MIGTELTGAVALLQALERLGVERIFGIPGTGEAALLDALAERSGIEYVLALHEDSLCAMADGCSRASGRPALLNLHAMPGTANALGAVHTALKDRVPLVVTATEQDSRLLGRDPHTSGPDLPSIFRPVTKWAWQVTRPDRLVDDLVRAFKVADTHPRGPVFLAIPNDFLGAPVPPPDADLARKTLPSRIAPDPAMVERAADLLLAAERPVLLAGGEVVVHGATAALLALAELLALPVVAESFGIYLGAPTSHPLVLGEYRGGQPVFGEADVLLGVGCKVFLEVVHRPRLPIPVECQIIHTNLDPWELGKNAPCDVGIVADPYSALTALAAAVRERLTPAHAARIGERRARIAAWRAEIARQRQADLDAARDAVPMQPATAIGALRDVLDRDAILVNQSVSNGTALTRFIETHAPDGFMMNTSAWMGWGPGAAIGVKMAKPDRQVVATLGDGALAFGVQALWSAARYEVPVLFFVFNNQQYMSIKASVHDAPSGHSRATGRYVGTHLTDPPLDIPRISEGFGVWARRVEEPAALRAALAEALALGKPALLDVAVDRDELGYHRVPKF